MGSRGRASAGAAGGGQEVQSDIGQTAVIAATPPVEDESYFDYHEVFQEIVSRLGEPISNNPNFNKILKQHEAAIQAHLSRINNFDALTDAEKKAAIEWTTAKYKDINKITNGELARSPRLQQLRDNLDSAIAKSTLSESTILTRSIRLEDAVAAGISPGSVISHAGFSATSAGGIGLGNFTLRIRARKGTKALVIGNNSKKRAEHEVLLGRNTRFEVTQVTSKFINPSG